MSSSKKLTCKRTLWQAQNPINPHPPPLTHCSVFVYTVTCLFTQGRGVRVEPERRLEELQFTKLGRKY
jgi:hypothetical protein